MKQIFFITLVLFSLLSKAQDTLYNYYKGLTINEFYVGERGVSEYHWIEFYNSSNHQIDLKGLYLTSSKEEVTMSRFDESLKIDSGEFIVIYLNKVPDNQEQTAFVNVNNEENYFAISYHSADRKILIDEIAYSAVLAGKTYVNESIGRYPDGEGTWLQMRNKTPNSPNSGQIANTFYTSETLLGIKMHYGLSMVHFRQSDVNSFTIVPNTAHSLGFYFRQNFSYYQLTFDAIYTKRSYFYQYAISDSTLKAVYTKEINGTQKVGALEIGTSLGVNLTRKINVFWGLNLGVAVISRFQYTQKTSGQLFKKDADGNQSWIPFSEKHTAPSEGNYSGTDIIKINAMYGLRYELYDHLHITLVYVNDIWGINFSEENLARSYKYRTLLLGIEVPLTFNKITAKSIF